MKRMADDKRTGFIKRSKAAIGVAFNFWRSLVARNRTRVTQMVTVREETIRRQVTFTSGYINSKTILNRRPSNTLNFILSRNQTGKHIITVMKL